MNEQFRNVDLKGPAKVRIMWAMETPTDEDSTQEFANDPTSMDEGYFPSLDPDAAGYIGPNPERSYQEQLDSANARYQDLCNGGWEYVGVIAVMRAWIPIGNGSYVIHTFKSGGVWGIESDSADYLKEVFQDQKEELLENLKTLGAALTSEEYIDQTPMPD